MERVIAMCVLSFISFRVFKDARSRGMNAPVWAAFVFLLLILGLPFYFISRKPKIEIPDQNDQSEIDNITKEDE